MKSQILFLTVKEQFQHMHLLAAFSLHDFPTHPKTCQDLKFRSVVMENTTNIGLHQSASWLNRPYRGWSGGLSS